MKYKSLTRVICHCLLLTGAGVFASLLRAQMPSDADEQELWRQIEAAEAEQTAARKTAAAQVKRNLDKEEAARMAAIVGVFLDIPGGSFSMGCSPGDADCDADEKPPHTVTVKSFRMGKHEVTFAQWDACVAEGGCDQKPNDQGWGRGTRPVININWDDARQFLSWAGRKTGRTLRLPTEAEWEYAARAGGTSKYQWGSTITHENANYGSDSCCTGKAEGHDEWINTAPVGSFPPNALGLHDMAGNVLEWTQDCWNDSYNSAPTDGSAWTVGDCSLRVIRGGSWGYFPRSVRSSSRDGSAAVGRGNELGFRLVQEL